jgi:hypothetical protein
MTNRIPFLVSFCLVLDNLVLSRRSDEFLFDTPLRLSDVQTSVKAVPLLGHQRSTITLIYFILYISRIHLKMLSSDDLQGCKAGVMVLTADNSLV